MNIGRPQVEILVKEKAASEKNEWYLYFLEEVNRQLRSVQEGLGSARTADYATMKFEQGRIDALGWMIRRPDKLMNEIIKSLEND